MNPRTSTTSCAGVPTLRLMTPESASYRDSSGYFTLHWVLRDSTNIPCTMRSSNWYYAVLPTTLMSHTHDTAWLALESHAREYCYELHILRYAAVKEIRSQPCRSRLPHRTASGRPLPCDINRLLIAAVD